MLKKLTIVLILVGMALAQTPLFSRVARQFNTFVEGRYECHGSETLGRLGAGGNLTISNYAVACGLLNPYTETCLGSPNARCGQLGEATCCDTSSRVCEYGLVGGSSVSARSGSLRHGSLAYRNQLFIDQSFSVQCQRTRTNLVNFNFEFGQLRSTCNRLAQLRANGRTTLQFGTNLVLTGDGSNRPQIFSVRCSQLQSATSVRLERVASTTTVIINVSGSSSCSIRNKGFNRFNPAYTIWNFPAQVRALSLSGIGLPGTLLAPFADLNEPLNGNIKGHIFCKSWVARRQGCIEQHWYPYRGQNPLGN